MDWERVNERLPYSKTDEGEEIIKISSHLDVDDKDNQLCFVAKEKRKEMWRAIDVNDNGYASLSEITRVGRFFFFIIILQIGVIHKLCNHLLGPPPFHVIL